MNDCNPTALIPAMTCRPPKRKRVDEGTVSDTKDDPMITTEDDDEPTVPVTPLSELGRAPVTEPQLYVRATGWPRYTVSQWQAWWRAIWAKPSV